MALEGNVRIDVFDAKSLALIDQVWAQNKIVLSGRNRLRDLLGYPFLGGAGFVPDYIAIGSSNNAVADGNTALGAEVFRKQITRRAVADQALTFRLFVAASEANGSGSQNLNEAGLFDVSAGGTMFARVTYTLITKTSAVSLTYNWTWSVASSG